jgi:WS/DGAT/MGAT family acyltransferase
MQAHGDRLSALDASFLAQEGPAAHMHVGALLRFEGPPPSCEALCDHVRGRLHLVPRYRQRLAFPPLETGRAVWVDDARFALEYHVRDTALPSPGSDEQLRALVARVHSQALDRAKPLWELWLVSGLEDGGFALISKNHHALVDGVAGMDLVAAIFDLAPVPAPVPHGDAAWTPQPAPSAADLAARGVRAALRAPRELVSRALDAAARPAEALEAARDAVEGLGEIAWEMANPAPSTPLNVEIGPHRRFAWVRCELAEVKRVKDALGGTVNDVVLAVVTGALRRWLRARGVRPEGLELRALVPVSVRRQDEHGAMGNRLVAMRAPLPVYVADPVARLEVVRHAMDALKTSKQAVGGAVLTRLERFAPPALLAQASRLNFSTRLFNLLVTNVPGPPVPLYLLGRELLDLVPVAFLPRQQALAVAAMSYAGRIDFGLLGDYDAMADLDDLGGHLEASLAELVAAARARSPASAGAPA